MGIRVYRVMRPHEVAKATEARMLAALFVVAGTLVCAAEGAGAPRAAGAPFAQPLQATGRAESPAEYLPTPPDAAPFISAMGERPEHVWLDGDVLHFGVISTADMVSVVGGLQRPLERVPGSDLWLLRVRLADWSKGVVSYMFYEGPVPERAEFKVWRGPDAPAEPRRSDAPPRVEEFSFDSPALGESRTVTVALPAGEHAGPLPALIVADGGVVPSLAPIIQALIDDGRMRPIALVGIHSGGYKGDRSAPYDPSLDMRAREYVRREDPERFDAHLRWVTDEVMPEVSRRFNVSTSREDLAVYGFSNGGAFAAEAGVHAGDRFGAVIACSVGVPPEAVEAGATLPQFFFAAGVLEPGFLKGSTQAHELVSGAGAESELQAFVAGHDSTMWYTALSEFAPRVFPPGAGAGAVEASH